MYQCRCSGELWEIRFNYLGWFLVIGTLSIWGYFASDSKTEGLLGAAVFPMLICFVMWTRYAYGFLGNSVVKCRSCDSFFRVPSTKGFRVKRQFFVFSMPVRQR